MRWMYRNNMELDGNSSGNGLKPHNLKDELIFRYCVIPYALARDSN